MDRVQVGVWFNRGWRSDHVVAGDGEVAPFTVHLKSSFRMWRMRHQTSGLSRGRDFRKFRREALSKNSHPSLQRK